MKKCIMLFLFFLIVGCSFYNFNEYPLENISLKNFENKKDNSNVTKTKKFDFKYCNYLYFSAIENLNYDFENILNQALVDFNKRYKLEENEYITNISKKVTDRLYIPIFYSRVCEIINFDVLERK